MHIARFTDEYSEILQTQAFVAIKMYTIRGEALTNKQSSSKGR